MKLTIRFLLVAGAIASLLIMGVALIYGVQQTIDMSASIQNAVASIQNVSRISSQIIGLMINQINLVQLYDSGRGDEAKRQFVEISFSIYEHYHALELSALSSQDLDKINGLKQEHMRLEALAMDVFNARDLGRGDEAEQALQLMQLQIDHLLPRLGALNDVNEMRSSLLTAELLSGLVQHGGISAAVILLMMLAALAFIYLVRRTVLIPVKKLITGTEMVAQGDLDFSVQLDIGNELGALSRSFNNMVARLRDNRTEISEKTATLEKLNDEILQLNEMLERKVRERTTALRRSESYLQRIILDSPVSIAIFSGDGVCRDCNDAFLRLTSLDDKKNVVESSRLGEAPALADPELVAAFREAVHGVKARTAPILHSPRGKSLWFVHNLFPVSDPGQSKPSVIMISEDVTEQAIARDAVQKKNRELESFVYTVSHDLKSPIFSISGLIRILERDDIGEFQNKQALLGRIHNNLANMEHMINDLLQLSRVGLKAIEYVRVDLREIVQRIILEEKVRHGLSTLDIRAEPLPSIVADERQITQLIRNLFDNAIKYADREHPPSIRFNCAEEDNQYRFCVADNGIGVEPDVADKIFDVFFRDAPESVEGTGVGLAIAKKIVENHGGRIWYEPVAGRGSSFHFTLAKIPEPEQAAIRTE